MRERNGANISEEFHYLDSFSICRPLAIFFSLKSVRRSLSFLSRPAIACVCVCICGASEGVGKKPDTPLQQSVPAALIIG